MISQKINKAFLLLLCNLLYRNVFAGELPVPPDELSYPNIFHPVFEYKSWGYGERDFNDPYTCRYLPDGNLAVADFENKAIKIVNTKSGSIKNFGLFRSGGKSFYEILPYSIGYDKSRNLLVADRQSKTLMRFDEQGIEDVDFNSRTKLKIFGEIGKISLSEDRIAVPDLANNSVVIFNSQGEKIEEFGKFGDGDYEFNSPESVAFDSHGDLYVLDSNNNRVQVFSKNYKLLRKFGSWGSYRGLIANPSDIFIDKNDWLYIADLLNHRIQVFTLDGNFKFQFGRHPPTAHEGKGRVHYPTSVSVSEVTGNIAVCEPFESRIQEFSLTSLESVKSVNDSAWWDKGTKFHYGTKVATSREAMAVSEPDTHAVLFYDLKGTQTSLVQIVGGQGSNPGEFIRPSGLVVDDKSGNLFVSDSGNRRIQKFSFNLNKEFFAAQPTPRPKLNFVASYSVLEPPNQPMTALEKDVEALNPASGLELSAIHIGPDGKMYAADPYGNRILRLTDDFKIEATIGALKGKLTLNKPLDFSFSKDGKFIFVVDHYHYRVMKYRLDGKFIKQIGSSGDQAGKFILPFGIASGVDGFIYVTDVGAQRVQKFSENGDFVATWGKWGTEPGEFYKPKGIAQTPDGTLIVIDFGNHRAQMFKSNGEFIRIFGIENAVVTPVRP